MDRAYKEIIKQLESTADIEMSVAQHKAIEEAADIISDYENVIGQIKALIEKYEQVAVPIKRDMNYYQCPACTSRIMFKHSHCHYCGKKMIWE